MFKTILTRIFFILIFVLSFASQAFAMTLSASPNPATMNKTVSFKINASYPGGSANYFINFGDGGADVALGLHSGNITLTATHTYSQSGVYTARAYADDLNVVNPNPVYLSVRVSDFGITRLETKFENNLPQITIKRKQPVPDLYTKINFSGSGFIKGYWEVDGFKRNYVFKHLSIGPDVILKYPGYPSLPSFTPGSHIVRFVITHPTLDINFPRAVYYVTPDDFVPVSKIKFLVPGKNEVLTYQPMEFKWQIISSATLYLVSFYSDQENVPIFSAYAIKGSYAIRPDVLKSNLVSGRPYLLQVQGFNDKNQLLAESDKIPFTFKE